MLRNRNWGLCLVALALMAGACLAQDAVPPKFYKLEFVVKEVEGTKVLNARAFSVTASTDRLEAKCLIRTGSKLPTPGGGYLDVGVNIDCYNVKQTQIPEGVSLTVSADISSIPQEPPMPGSAPMIRQNRWTSNVIVPLKKPTVLFSSDDLTTKHQMQLELTATPIT